MNPHNAEPPNTQQNNDAASTASDVPDPIESAYTTKTPSYETSSFPVSVPPVSVPADSKPANIWYRGYGVIVIIASVFTVLTQITAQGAVISGGQGLFILLDVYAYIACIIGIYGGIQLLLLHISALRMLKILHIVSTIVLFPISFILVLMLAAALSHPLNNLIPAIAIIALFVAWCVGFQILYTGRVRRLMSGGIWSIFRPR
jgi:hypothetical protein